MAERGIIGAEWDGDIDFPCTIFKNKYVTI